MDRIDALLLEWEEGRDQGRPLSPDALCSHYPELCAELTEAVRLLEAFDERVREDSAEAPPVPTRIGKYEVHELLGRGGMGVVYRGWDPSLRRTVAIKMLHFSLPTPVARFVREGRALAQLKHPNVVSIYEAGTEAGEPYFVMEYVPGGTAAEQRTRLTAAGPSAVVRLVERVARAVQFAHERGVLHRDLKPSNILLGPDDEPLVGDFGLAKLRDPEPEGLGSVADEVAPDARPVVLTRTAQPGTPAYMAPEQFAPGIAPLSPATDVWALGVILYELTTGTRPFAAADYAALAREVLRPPDLTAVRRRIGRQLTAVIERCLQIRPERRYRSAVKLADALACVGRVSRRTVLGWVVGGAAVAVPIGVALADPYRRFRLRTYPFTRSLAAGESVDVVAPGVVPTYYAHLGADVAQVGARDGCWVVRSTALTVLELVPELPATPCRVAIEVRHDHSAFQADPHGGSGLIHGYGGAPDGDGRSHFVSRVAFDDWGQLGLVHNGSLWLPGAQAGGAPQPPVQFTPVNGGRNYPAPATRPAPYRTFELIISPTGMTGQWVGPPGFSLGPLPRPVIDEHIDQLRERHPADVVERVKGDWRPRVGLIVSGGQVSVRSLRISPQVS